MGNDDQPREPTPENHTLFQAFEWNTPPAHWPRLHRALPSLKAIGIDNLWLPPGCKAASPNGNGYDIYDLWDLGEFDQKGARSTKWGSKDELLQLCRDAKEQGVGIYWDAVPNHKAGADRKEKCRAVEVNENNREETVSEAYEIEAWVGFDFPGRGEQFSKLKYHWYHFSGVDYNAANDKKAIYKILGEEASGEDKGWSETVDDQQGNADFLMFADLDYANLEVENDVKEWSVWIAEMLGLKGFRLDAVQHFSQRFTKAWIQDLRERCGGDMFVVGEFWVNEVDTLLRWLDDIQRHMCLYDAPLVSNFSRISTTVKGDLRGVFDATLVQKRPVSAVTLVMNHDTQPGQTVQTPVEGFFKPLAYSLILLRRDGYPCVFYGDLYGMKGEHPEPPSCGNKLADLVLARKLYAYGDQDDYWDDANSIGFVRRGTWDRPAGLACLMSNAGPGEIRMAVGDLHAGEVWTDILGWEEGEVVIDEEGYGLFRCPGVSVSVWVRKDAQGRDQFPLNFDADIYRGESEKE